MNVIQVTGSHIVKGALFIDISKLACHPRMDLWLMCLAIKFIWYAKFTCQQLRLAGNIKALCSNIIYIYWPKCSDLWCALLVKEQSKKGQAIDRETPERLREEMLKKQMPNIRNDRFTFNKNLSTSIKNIRTGDYILQHLLAFFLNLRKKKFI